MRSFFIILAISPLSLALPLQQNPQTRDLKSILEGLAGNGAKPSAVAAGNCDTTAASSAAGANATAAGTASAALNDARAKVVDGLNNTANALNKVSAQANATGNAGVQSLVAQAQTGLTAAQGGVSKINDELNAGQTPAKSDQAVVAQGIADAGTAVSGMKAAITTPNKKLSKDIAQAVKGVNLMKAGVQGVLAAENLTLADLGLNSTTAV